MADAFLAYRDAGHNVRFLIKIEDHFRNTLIREVTAQHIKDAARKLYPGCTPATWNRQVLSPTQAAINILAERGQCQFMRVKRFPENPKTKKAATPEWVQAFAAQAQADDLPHLAAICLFMFGTAARIGEACALRWADVDLSGQTATIRMGKPVPWSRTAYLPMEVVAALANIPSNRNPEAEVFGYAGRGSVQQSWDRVCERAKIERLTPHCCRHGFATTMLRKGFDVKTVAKRGGWKDARTVLNTYAHALEDLTVTEALFDTNTAHPETGAVATAGSKRENRP